MYSIYMLNIGSIPRRIKTDDKHSCPMYIYNAIHIILTTFPKQTDQQPQDLQGSTISRIFRCGSMLTTSVAARGIDQFWAGEVTMKLLLPSLFPQAPEKVENKEHMHITWLHTYKYIIRIDIPPTKGGSTKTEWPNKPLQSLRLLDRHRHIARLARTLFGLASEVSGGMFWGPGVTNCHQSSIQSTETDCYCSAWNEWEWTYKLIRINKKTLKKYQKIKSHGKKKNKHLFPARGYIFRANTCWCTDLFQIWISHPFKKIHTTWGSPADDQLRSRLAISVPILGFSLTPTTLYGKEKTEITMMKLLLMVQKFPTTTVWMVLKPFF